MTIKQKFIQEVQELFESAGDVEQDVLDYFETFKKVKEKKSTEITENGKAIIEYMQETCEREDVNNAYKSRDIAEGMFTSSRSVSGAMRKLVNDGFVDKTDDSPIVYSLTDKGKTYSV